MNDRRGSGDASSPEVYATPSSRYSAAPQMVRPRNGGGGAAGTSGDEVSPLRFGGFGSFRTATFRTIRKRLRRGIPRGPSCSDTLTWINGRPDPFSSIRYKCRAARRVISNSALSPPRSEGVKCCVPRAGEELKRPAVRCDFGWVSIIIGRTSRGGLGSSSGTVPVDDRAANGCNGMGERGSALHGIRNGLRPGRTQRASRMASSRHKFTPTRLGSRKQKKRQRPKPLPLCDFEL